MTEVRWQLPGSRALSPAGGTPRHRYRSDLGSNIGVSLLSRTPQRAAGRPGGSRMLRHVELQYPSAIVAQDDQNEKDAECGCGYRDNVKHDVLFGMVLEKRPPVLNRWSTTPDHGLRRRGLGDIDPKLQLFSMHARHRQRIYPAHAPNKIPDPGFPDRSLAVRGDGSSSANNTESPADAAAQRSRAERYEEILATQTTSWITVPRIVGRHLSVAGGAGAV